MTADTLDRTCLLATAAAVAGFYLSILGMEKEGLHAIGAAVAVMWMEAITQALQPAVQKHTKIPTSGKSATSYCEDVSYENGV